MNVKKKCYHNIYKEKNKMRFFLDTANVEEIKKANDMGVICGVTIPLLLLKKVETLMR